MQNDLDIEDDVEEKLFEICFSLFRVTKDFLCNITLEKGKRKDKVVFARYLCIAYLFETKQLTRERLGEIFNMDHSSITCALKKAEILAENGDSVFCSMLESFNTLLLKRGLRRKIRLNNKVGKYRRKKLNKEDMYHLKFMLKQDISTIKLSDHFKISKYAIENVKEAMIEL